jgi:hypothetical protein
MCAEAASASTVAPRDKRSWRTNGPRPAARPIADRVLDRDALTL